MPLTASLLSVERGEMVDNEQGRVNLVSVVLGLVRTFSRQVEVIGLYL
jgi:hypothetical protein